MTRPSLRLAPLGMLLAAIAFALAGCAPSIVVHNGTSFAIRVVITANGGSEVLSPSPGEDSTGDAAEGSYHVVVIPDADWIAWATATRAYLNERLANAESLTGPQLLDVVARLKDIAAKMQSYTAAAGGTSGCGGSVSSDANGLVTVTQAADGTLLVSCK